MESINADIAIVGGGITGCATAYSIQIKNPNLKILLFEKERELALHQSGRNSGVIHSGIYYAPNSFKAKFCVKGRRQFVEFAKKFNVPHKITGKIVVATSPQEVEILHSIYNRGLENDVEDIEIISSTKIKEIEPNVEGIEAIRVGCTGITDFAIAAKKMAQIINEMNPQSMSITNMKLVNLDNTQKEKILIFNNNRELVKVKAKVAVFACGLHADKVAHMDGFPLPFTLLPFRGDFFKLKENAKDLIKNIVYPVPHPLYPFLGIHFTRMINGEVECGPNALPSFSRENYSRNIFSFGDFWRVATNPSALKFFIKNISFGISQFQKFLSKEAFLKEVKKMVPKITPDDLVYMRNGIRAILINKEGKIYEDFYIGETHRGVHLISAPSPAATACLAIGSYLAEIVFRLLESN